MLRFSFIIIYLLSFNTLNGSDEKGMTFIKQLLQWNINYNKLNNFKAGAICINKKNRDYPALGFSYNLANIDYAKKIALEGCVQMKKKNKIPNDCKCEIIFINDNFVGKEK
jgi:hypothetical protein